MAETIMDMCDATGNEHFKCFPNLLDMHFSGIIAHARYQISTGKIEGIDQKIKTLRRQG
ncbi:transposase [Candidatus Weimeria sp. HCP3S3_B5]|uniref:transposase n=1 Tax=Candidatus Weimeria sp. HCP3S3_B5 TaxID=3438871 RepID=UPI003F8902BA